MMRGMYQVQVDGHIRCPPTQITRPTKTPGPTTHPYQAIKVDAVLASYLKLG